MSFIDIHCHILPGIDDGPDGIEESVDMVKLAIDDGVSHIFATPHIIDGLYDNKTQGIIDSLNSLKKSIPDGITLLHGADVGVMPDIVKRIEIGDVPTLSGSAYLLLELPHYVIPPHMDNLIFNLRQRSIIPIITHPERHACLMNDLSTLNRLKDIGAMCQLTAMSITGGFGRDIRRASLSMIEKGLVDFVASDAHDSRRRPPILSKAYREVERELGNEVAERIFLHNPNKILGAIL